MHPLLWRGIRKQILPHWALSQIHIWYRVLGRCLTALWSMSSKEGAESHSEHLHQPLYVAPLSGFLSENYSVRQAWRSNMTILSASPQIQLLVLSLHFDFWLEDDWSHSKLVNLHPQLWAGVSTFMYKVADFARREFLSSRGLPERVQCITLLSSKIREYGSTAHCTCSAFFSWLWSLSKQLLHHLH